jgi:hypothetical protein
MQLATPFYTKAFVDLKKDHDAMRALFTRRANP